MCRLATLVLAVVVASVLVGTAAADDAKPGKGEGKGKRDGAALFKRLDANNDGKITLDEFKKLGERAQGKVKDRPELGERLFKRLDANNDGAISPEEAKKLGEGLKGRKPAKP